MTLNPFLLLLFIYTSANTYSLITLLSNGGFEAFGIFYKIEKSSAGIAYFLQLFSLLFICAFFFTAKEKQKNIIQKIQLSDRYGYFLIAVTAAFFFFNQFTGAGRAGSDFTFSGNSLANYLFVLIQPDLWFFLIAPFLRSNRIFLFSTALFLTSMLSRGWMGSVLIIGCILLIRLYPLKLNSKNIAAACISILMIVATLPFLDALKWGMRLGIPLGIIIDSLLEKDYLESLAIVIDSVVSRLQNLNYVAFAVENYDSTYRLLLNGQIGWFFQNGIFSSVYCKLTECAPDVGIYMAESISGSYNLSWNIDLGFAGWIAVLNILFPTFLIFASILLFAGNLVAGKLFGEKGILLLGVFSLIYLFHGWINAFANLTIYLIAFYLFTKTRTYQLKKTEVEFVRNSRPVRKNT